jgi:iron complex transport system ATP-binding protein
MSLKITDLSAGYGRTQVLHNVTADAIKSGQFVGLIGPNASGKSTMFKTLSGLLRPMAGTIHLGDTDLGTLNRRDRARRIAYMPQAFGCNAILTVYESVLLALKRTTGWRVEEDNLDRVSQTLAALNLAHLANRSLGNLSGGQAQMVAVAQTLVRNPDIALLDEPTCALDLHHHLSILSSEGRQY